jgi:plastocyanin
MKKLILACAVISLSLAVSVNAAVWQVSTTTGFRFSPQDITIAQGDTVVWTNPSGTHNVIEESDPPLFYSGDPGSGWEYTFVFDVPAGTYNYHCVPHESMGMVGSVTVEISQGVEEQIEVASNFYVPTNYPNPFNPETTIQFALPQAQNVRLEVFNALGQSVAVLVEGQLSAGIHRQSFAGANLPSGLYFYQLLAGDHRETRRMMLLK